MLYLKNFIKYRKEKDYVLLCDCSIIQNYELSLDYYNFLEQLRLGIDISSSELTEDERELINDFIDLELVDSIPNSNKGFHEKQWISLGYDENEFY